MAPICLYLYFFVSTPPVVRNVNAKETSIHSFRSLAVQSSMVEQTASALMSGKQIKVIFQPPLFSIGEGAEKWTNSPTFVCIFAPERNVSAHNKIFYEC